MEDLIATHTANTEASTEVDADVTNVTNADAIVATVGTNTDPTITQDLPVHAAGAVLPSYMPTVADSKLDSIYIGHMHENPSTHLLCKIVDDAL